MKNKNILLSDLKDVQENIKILQDKIYNAKSHIPYINEYNRLNRRLRNIQINLNQMNQKRKNPI